MRKLRLLLVLCSLAFSLAVALARPLPARADNGGDVPAPTPDPVPPTNADPVVPQLPVVKAVRKPASVTRHARSFFGERVADYAKRFLGTRYVYGGSSPRTGFDCSGFVRYVYAHFGVSLAHSSFAQFGRGMRVSRWGLKPGDLVFFDGLGHVGLYLGNGRFIHAPRTGLRVEISPLSGWYSYRFAGARRLRIS